MEPVLMHLEVLLPFRVHLEAENVTRVTVETPSGSFGLLPERLDCVAALVPGILSYATAADGPVFLAVDEGVLVKAGSSVLVSVRRAVGGADLGRLRDMVAEEFLDIDARERDARSTMARLESGFLRRLAGLRRG